MKILVTSHTFWPERTGVAEAVGNICAEFTMRGHDVWVATEGAADASSLAGTPKVVRFRCVGNLVLGLSGEIERYTAFVRSQRWDVVMLHCAQSWTTDAIIPLLSSLSCPIVFVGHGFSQWNNSAYASYFVSLAGALRARARIVCLANALEESTFCDRFGLGRPTVIPNGVNLAEWQPISDGDVARTRARYTCGSGAWLVAVGNHAPVKGHDRFFRLVRTLRDGGVSFSAAIIGKSHRAERYRLGKLGVRGGCWYRCALRALGGDVRLLADLGRVDVVSAIKSADVVAITSYREAYPIVALECMAAGVPWVAFGVGAIYTMSGGVIVQSESEMAKMVSKLLSDRTWRLELGRVGRRAIEESHSWSMIADKYLSCMTT